MTIALFQKVLTQAIKKIFAADENLLFKRTYVEKFLDAKHINISMEKLDSKEACTGDALGTTVLKHVGVDLKIGKIWQMNSSHKNMSYGIIFLGLNDKIK